MYAIIDALIFPAPSSHYTSDSLEGKLIYIPKYKQYVPDRKLFEINKSSKRKRKNTLDAVQRENKQLVQTTIQSLNDVGLWKL